MSTHEPYILTYSGHRFPFLNPQPSDFRIRDIAHALAHLCRFGGHVARFYSVAEHCVHISYAVPDEDRMYGLLHDLSEAYLVDMPRPVKKRLVGYLPMEQPIQEAGQEAFGLAWGTPASVTDADNRILIDERDALMPPDADYGDWPKVAPFGIRPQCWTPCEAEVKFLARFYELGGVPS